jgi:signal peptide peptidase SppA
MRRELLIGEFLSIPWAMEQTRLRAMTNVLTRWQAGIPASQDVLASIAADREARDARRAAAATPGTGGIAVLPLYGVVTQRGNMADDVSGPGSMSVQQFTGALRSALADPTVGQILIDIDSPGGSVYGVQELATEMMAARSTKPIVAIANSLCASAAYWIGCCASELYVTPGGEVGSIGVWQAHQDCSEAMAEAGVKTTLISAGKYKTEGNPYAPLDADAQAFLQSRVDDYYQAFSKGVAKARGVGIDAVRNGMGQGRVLGADAALAEHMVDGIATFDEVVKKMQKSAKTAGRPAGVSRLAAMQRDLAILG